MRMEAIKKAGELVLKILGFTSMGTSITLIEDIIKTSNGNSDLMELVSYIAQSSEESPTYKNQRNEEDSEMILFARNLATACKWAQGTEKAVVEIPRYYKIKKKSFFAHD